MLPVFLDVIMPISYLCVKTFNFKRHEEDIIIFNYNNKFLIQFMGRHGN